MEDDFRYRVNYSENVAPKYPAASQEGLEVVPNDSPLYPLPPTNAFTPVYPVDTEKWTPTSNTRGWADFPASAVTAPEDRGDETAEKRRILGLTVPIFWALVVFVVIILAGGIGGGIGGGLTKLNNTVARSVYLEYKCVNYFAKRIYEATPRMYHKQRQQHHHRHHWRARRHHPGKPADLPRCHSVVRRHRIAV